ncbi:MAG: DNA polymerase [Anaerolineales bacterium]
MDALPSAINPKTNRVHTSYSQIGAVTGRLSSNNPNLQNIPIRTETGRRVRNGFIAGKGNVLLSVDYSQIELRIVAHMAQDDGMLAAFRADEDIHATTAAAIYNVALDAVTKDMRRHAESDQLRSQSWHVRVWADARHRSHAGRSGEFRQGVFHEVPGVKKYLDGIRKQAAQQGDTLKRSSGGEGISRSAEQDQSTDESARRTRSHQRANSGTAADIMKIAMLKIPPALKKAKLNGKMLLQVHDELVLECPKDELEKTAKVVKETMANAYLLDIPLSTEARYGANWGEMKVI